MRVSMDSGSRWEGQTADMVSSIAHNNRRVTRHMRMVHAPMAHADAQLGDAPPRHRNRI